MLYLVVFDHPYYPEVEVFDTLDLANARRDEILAEHNDPEVEHESVVYVCQLVSKHDVRTAY